MQSFEHLEHYETPISKNPLSQTQSLVTLFEPAGQVRHLPFPNPEQVPQPGWHLSQVLVS